MCIEILTSIAGAIAGEIAKHAITPVGRLMGYPISYKSDIKIFGEKLQDLKLARKSMQDRIDEARTKGEVIEEEVLKWLNEVDEIIKDADDFLQKGAQAKTSCSGCVLRLNWGLRRRRSREAKTTKAHFEENINKGQCFHRISHPPEVDYLRNTGFEKFDTREKKMTEVLKALGDSDVRTIGVHGMAGVGKTMFAKAVARQAEKQKLITKPIFTTVSQTPNIEKMQDEIAEQLGMKLDEKSTAVRRAAYLGNRLKQENTLIVLDDIWEPLDLPKTIGICFEETQNGCKVLMTSRDQNVLGSHMEDKNIFRVELLSISETTDLFKSIVGKKIEESEFRELGTKLIEECGNLPLAVTTIAHALKPGKLHSWQNALTQLQRSSWPLISGIDAHVSKSIMWSYDFWDTNEEAKKLLLLCSLHGEDEEISVEDLMRCGVGLGLFQGINNFEEGRNMVRSLLDKLKDRCLLLSGVNHDTVKMHDVIRDVIIAIPSKDACMHQRTKTARLEEEALTESIAISVLDSDSCELPQRLECPKLKLFLMLKAKKSLLIPDEFFVGAKALRVLYVSSVRLQSLPTSFIYLQNIKILCFRNCELRDIALIGNLKSLEVLDLSWSHLEKLPEEIGQLTRLRLLSVEYCPNLKVIPFHVISSLKNLEEFYKGEAFIDCEINQVVESETSSILFKLSTLHLRMKDAGMEPNDLFNEAIEFGQMRSLTLQYLHKSSESNSSVLLFNEKVAFPSLEALELSEINLKTLWPDQLPTTYFKTLKSLIVRRCNNLRHLLTLDVFQSLAQLEDLKISECRDMEEVLFAKVEPASDEEGKFENIPFSRLKILELWDLPNLKRFWAGNFVECPSLQKLDIKRCPKLNTFMTFADDWTRRALRHGVDTNQHFVQNNARKRGRAKRGAELKFQ